VPGGGLSAAAARHLTPYGEAAVSWERADGQFSLRVDVPVGTTATVHLPGAGEPAPAPARVTHGHHEWLVADPLADPPATGS